MKINVWVIAALALAAFPVRALEEVKRAPLNKEIAASFVAEAKGNTIAIYSNLKKPRRCEVYAYFTVMQNGERVLGAHRCLEKDIPAGKHVLVCDFTRPQVVDPLIDGPVNGYCK